jgi:NitT/TauT family transport system substrate-binding protein
MGVFRFDQGALLNRALSFSFDWIAGAQFAGLYWAREHGFYEAVGLSVTLEPWHDDGLSMVEKVSRPSLNGELRAGCAEDNLIVKQACFGGSMMAFGSMLQDPPLVVMSRPEHGIQHVRDLRGKRVGMHADGIRVLEMVLALEGIAVDEIDLHEVGYDLEHLVSDGFDALQGYVMTEPLQLAAMGVLVNVLPIRHHRLLPYAQVYFADRSALQQQPNVFADFLAASSAGWNAVCEDPSAASRMLAQVISQSSAVNPGQIEPPLQAEQRAMLDRLIPLVEGDRQRRIGQIDEDQWRRNLATYAEFGLINGTLELDQVVFAST